MPDPTPAPATETAPVAAAPAAAPAAPTKHVTPVNTGHKLYGSIFPVIGEEEEYVYGEIKTAFEWIWARFHKSEVRESNPPVTAGAPHVHTTPPAVTPPATPAATTAPAA